jgi:hypothetical protein
MIKTLPPSPKGVGSLSMEQFNFFEKMDENLKHNQLNINK